MKQADVFSILMILLNKRRVSRDYLAERFSVSKRTISRYLSVLEDAGVPIVSVTGRGGGISLDENYIFDKSFLSEAEMLRLKDALERTSEKYGDKVNHALAEKIGSVKRSRESDSYVIKQDGLYIDCSDAQAGALKHKINVISRAIEENRAVDIKYTDAHGFVSFRTIEPYTLVFKAEAWYVYAMCKLRGDFRLFKLNRICDLRKTSRTFVKSGGRLLEKLELEFYNEMYVELELEFFSAVRESITDWLGAQSVRERGAKLVACAEVPYTDTLVKRILAFGSSVKVLNPPELRDQLRDEAMRMAQIYSDA